MSSTSTMQRNEFKLVPVDTVLADENATTSDEAKMDSSVKYLYDPLVTLLHSKGVELFNYLTVYTVYFLFRTISIMRMGILWLGKMVTIKRDVAECQKMHNTSAKRI